MGTHWMIFLTIWQPRFSAQFPLPRTSEGAHLPPPLDERISPVLAARKNQAVKQWDLLSRAWHLRKPDVYS